MAVNISIILLCIVVLFQMALACGAPWGTLAMGGKYPGKLPPAIRVVTLVQIVLLVIIGVIILVRGGVVFPVWFTVSETVIWGVVIFNVIGLIANLATPSQWERIRWAPVAIILLVCSFVVAMS